MSNKNLIPNRRSGGRKARHAMRSAPLSKEKKPIKPGMAGGQYKPLSTSGVNRIHKAALDALEQIGLADAPQSGISYMTNAGAILGNDGRLRFPRALVEDMLALASRNLTLSARNSEYDLDLTGTNVHFGTAGAAVHLVDINGKNYKDSTVQDLFDAAKIVNKMNNIHFLQRPMVCRDILDNFEMDLNTIYACCRGTSLSLIHI